LSRKAPCRHYRFWPHTEEQMSAIPQIANERELLTQLLRKSRDTYLACLREVPEGACSARLTDDSWSILELAEHVAVAEHGMFRAVELGTEKNTPPNYSADAEVQRRGLNRDVKAKSPERSTPNGRWKTMAEAMDAFEKSRARTLDFVENGGRDLRKIESVHPLFGSLDAHQILLIMAAHAERHAAQIEDIKRTQEYRLAASK
jgi:uncharacterized damage-inducible protein DinB